VEALSSIFTTVIELGYVPSRGKTWDVIFIHKPGKTDFEKTRSFRPISLMSFVYKTLEKVVAMELEQNAFKESPMHEDQFGFVMGRSTEHALSATVNEIEKGLQEKEFVVVTLLDIEGAFDNIKPSAIIKAMRKQGIGQKVCNMYHQYLTNRRCSCTLSDKIVVATLIMGSPQGGLLSPSCGWNCSMNKLLKRLRMNKTHCKAFADDAALISKNVKLAQAMKNAQKDINVSVGWAKKMGGEFSVEKTVVMLFTNKRSSSYQIPSGLKIYAQEIPFSKTAKYLGVTIVDKLSWRPHIENKIKKAKRTLMAIRSVIGKSWGPSPECAKWSWTGVIRPALTFGAIVWSRSASQSWAKIKLQRLQRMALSQITHIRLSTPSAALEIMYGVPPLDLFIQNCAQNAAIRVKPDTSWQPPAKDKARVAHGRHLQHQFPAGLWQADTDEITHENVWEKNYSSSVAGLSGQV
jgi:hypothetical protein